MMEPKTREDKVEVYNKFLNYRLELIKEDLSEGLFFTRGFLSSGPSSSFNSIP